MGLENLDFTDLRIATVIPIFFILFRIAINTVGMLPVENLLLTNSKRLTIFFVHSLTLTIVILLFLIFSDPVEKPPNEEYNLFLVYVVTSIVIAMLAIGLVRLLTYIFSIKIRYFIVEKTDDEKWFIGRVVGNGKVLLYNKVNRYKFVNSNWLEDKIIDRCYKEKKNNKLIFFIEKHDKAVPIVVITAILFTSIYTLLKTETGSVVEGIFLVLLLIEFLIMMYVYVTSWNSRVMKEIDEANRIINFQSNSCN